MNKYQIAICLTYGGGDYAHLATVEDWEDHQDIGDTLFLFLMRELADDGEVMTAETAAQRIESAQRDLEGALAAIEGVTP